MIKENFRAFTAATIVLKQASDSAIKAIKEDKKCKSTTIEFNVDYAIIATMALPAWTAFAVEMGLKTLLVSTGVDENPHGHDLVKLFKKLPEDIQNKIKCETVNNLQSTEENDFLTILEKNKETFEKWRYFHERKSSESNTIFLQHLLQAIHNTTQ